MDFPAFSTRQMSKGDIRWKTYRSQQDLAEAMPQDHS